MNAVDAVMRALSDRLALQPTSIEKTAGGDINDAYRVRTEGGDLFVKTSASALPGAFRDEAAGLVWLAEPASAIRTPRVIGTIDQPDAESQAGLPRLLALEWIEARRLDGASEELLGRGLAAIHAAGAADFGATPLLDGDGSLAPEHRHAPMRFNTLALPNESCPTWAEFYAERRLRPLLVECLDRGRLSAEDANVIERVCDRLPGLAGAPEPPARTHGDLWAGNVMADRDGRPVLIDPVAHGGHREVDLALLRVFGGPSERCFAAYDEAAPLADGWRERIALWQLAMILLHVHLFGGGYREQALSIARQYA